MQKEKQTKAATSQWDGVAHQKKKVSTEKKNKRARNKLAQIWRRRGWTDRRLARPVCSSGWLCELWETLLLTVLPTHMHVHWREHFMCMALTPSDHSNSCCPKAKWQARKGGEGGLRLVFIWVCEEWVFEWISVRRVGGSVSMRKR